ncbi:Abortive infection protein [Beutenbergia cavernae DSM 12333]|uniref:Abortive infection protein n=1 Tax=Beutenbergia cavernae (strain ATCC BAA-8 / DSM 12333 / CCUG 43141 / JCM 11478 / NBRC 16432 / NCIMB 13614 / HKI 0122) TaxID=471853 RepID=C5BX86_BEUC1|nr:CPBP family intramembrane glutamic endopeptidase [Beutenbergia cavernae]ACQ78761.1 Abortive infection protein [Beutenbergia cavernae DSM 12333]
MSSPVEPSTARWRATPSVPVAAVVFVVYCVIVIGLMKAAGVGYEHFFDSAQAALRAVVLPLAAGAVWLTAFLVWARWDHVFRDARRLPTSWFLWILPGLMALVAVLHLLGLDWNRFTPGHVLAVLLASLLVGYTEETLFRGIVLRALRQGARSEGMAILWTTLWFGGFHLTNLLLNEPGAVLQVVFAALTGTALYLARRGTGTIIAAMALHALWDNSTFLAGVHTSDSGPALAANALTTVVYPLAAVTLVVLVVRDRRRPAREAITAEPGQVTEADSRS